MKTTSDDALSGAQPIRDPLRWIVQHPGPTLLLALVPLALLLASVRDFRVDASSNSIVLENDADLRTYDATRQTFGSDDSVFVAVTPEGDLFESETLAALGRLDDELEAVDGVASVTSVLDVPLFESPNRGLAQLGEGFLTLEDPAADLELAREELRRSPLFSDALLSEDGITTALQVTFAPQEGVAELEQERYELWDVRDAGSLSAEQSAHLREIDRELRRHDEVWSDARREQIEAIRAVIERHRAMGEIHLGGVPMITVDIVDYIERDMRVFGGAVLFLALLVLLLVFRSWRWTLIPTAVCALTVLGTLGLLGMLDRPATIVSSNFVSLLLIVTMAMVVHIVVRFRELHATHPDASHHVLVSRSVRDMARPCFYTALTTMVGFGSLYVSRIRPVMDFAWIMVVGIAVAYALSFLLLPAIALLLGNGRVPARHLGELDGGSPFTRIAEWSTSHRPAVVALALVLTVTFGVGVARLDVENRFVDYFDETSPIHEGMVFLDQRLGGTTPLEIVLASEEPDFWLDADRLQQLDELHAWLEEQPEVGKVQSITSLVRTIESAIESDPSPMVRQLKVGPPLLRMLLSRVPEDLTREALRPYTSADLSQVRLLARVRETDADLVRAELLARVRDRLGEAPVEGAVSHVTGMFVLYNNMLQSLFASQILTIGAVFAAIWVMFVVLFRSAKVASIALVPNVLPVIGVLGALGWLGIPLDMMTIMTAAVTLGIAVDDTIHFLHRFRHELHLGHSYRASMVRSLNSIGRAMVYTSVTIVVGFSVLVLSRFVPTVYFGIFTGFAMVVALLAAVSLLPLLVLWFEPFGPAARSRSAAPFSTPPPEPSAEPAASSWNVRMSPEERAR